jgi:hypothetical protein
MILLMCGSNQTQKVITPPDGKKTTDTTTKETDFRHYEKEGFISKDLFRIIVIQPFDSSLKDTDIEKQARNKALSSLKKHIASTGTIPGSKTDAELINLINDNGKINRVEDREHSRTLFVLDIEKTGCKTFVETLGK